MLGHFLCSLSKFWTPLELHSLGRFIWFKKPVLLIQPFSLTYDWIWKNLKHLNILKLALTLPLKSTTFHQLTEAWIKLFWIFVQIQFPSCKNNIPWDGGMRDTFHVKYHPSDFYDNLALPQGSASHVKWSIWEFLTYHCCGRAWAIIPHVCDILYLWALCYRKCPTSLVISI